MYKPSSNLPLLGASPEHISCSAGLRFEYVGVTIPRLDLVTIQWPRVEQFISSIAAMSGRGVPPTCAARGAAVQQLLLQEAADEEHLARHLGDPRVVPRHRHHRLHRPHVRSHVVPGHGHVREPRVTRVTCHLSTSRTSTRPAPGPGPPGRHPPTMYTLNVVFEESGKYWEANSPDGCDNIL